MHSKLHVLVAVMTAGALAVVGAQKREPTEKPGPPKSGFYDFWNAGSEFDLGIGIVQRITCAIGAATQPPEYAGNMLVDCDAEVPHNETSIAINPLNPEHAVGAYHSYQLSFIGATAIAHVVGTTSVTFDGGDNWQEIVPPITPYQFTGDPALAFDGDGRLYFANIADHEGPGRAYTAPSVVVARSDDGGLTWSNPVTVAQGQGAVTRQTPGVLVFQDKEFIAADTHAGSPYRNRVYVTWTSFQERAVPVARFRSPIMVSTSGGGSAWGPGREISGFSSDCSVQYGGGAANECDANQFSSPAVGPGGKVYVGFENYNTPAENQYMVVSSSDGGQTWSAPARVDAVHDINYPANVDGRSTLTGCQLRVASPGNIAVDPSDPTASTLYATWADNRNGTSGATNSDVFLARSADGGATWQTHLLDGSANDQFYPWVAVAPDGRVDVGYMDRTYSSGQGVCQYGFSLVRATFDGAGNMTTNVKSRVDTALSDAGHSRWFSATTNGNTRFIGDYNAVAVGSDGSTWSLWTDHRNIIPGAPPTRNHGQHAVGTRTP